MRHVFEWNAERDVWQPRDETNRFIFLRVIGVTRFRGVRPPSIRFRREIHKRFARPLKNDSGEKRSIRGTSAHFLLAVFIQIERVVVAGGPTRPVFLRRNNYFYTPVSVRNCPLRIFSYIRT